MRLHSFNHTISLSDLPPTLNNPFDYEPHPLCLEAFGIIQEYIECRSDWHEELSCGKMIGVLIVGDPTSGRIGFLASFSGSLDSQTSTHEYFVPPIYDILTHGGYYQDQDKLITQISQQISELESSDEFLSIKQSIEQLSAESSLRLSEYKSYIKECKTRRNSLRSMSHHIDQQQLIRESQHQKAELKRLERRYSEQFTILNESLYKYSSQIDSLRNRRKEMSGELQEWIFRQYRILSHEGNTRNLIDIFQTTALAVPPAAAGDCAAPKLLQYAFTNGLIPHAIAEFWWGDSPKSEIRHHGHHYPACKGKCEPILNYMLNGLPLMDRSTYSTEVIESHYFNNFTLDFELDIVYHDPQMIVINKPSGMLSVPGRTPADVSLFHLLKYKYPQYPGLMMVNRLDMDTSGLIVAATNIDSYVELQSQFANHSVQKRYVALLDIQDHSQFPQSGTIELPLSPNYLDRPRQMVDIINGKYAKTIYKFIDTPCEPHSRIWLWPYTGRTHQLRLHCAHSDGLGSAILGDRLYGSSKYRRMCLHSEQLTLTHPTSGEAITLNAPPDF